ncbi:MAG: hypothetical protein EU529_14780 [Promethearchaeota archaeon]|nr:MAG: hypothetical protein EU529_14780 [Candidatus Lokiarchaeota archaeon]
MICEYCRKVIKKNPVRLVNTQHSPSTHLFCSKRCKDWWCFSSQRKKPRIVIRWCIGKYLHKYFFVRNVDKNTGSNVKITYFSEKLNYIKELELFGSKLLRVRKAKAS